MSRIGWVIAGSVAALTTVAVSIKLALEEDDEQHSSALEQREMRPSLNELAIQEVKVIPGIL